MFDSVNFVKSTRLRAFTGSFQHLLGGVVRSEACTLGMQATPSLTPHVRHILSWRLGHEKISTAILPLLLIQEEQLSVTGERMYTKYQ